jgi:hypothetical protein
LVRQKYEKVPWIFRSVNRGGEEEAVVSGTSFLDQLIAEEKKKQ